MDKMTTTLLYNEINNDGKFSQNRLYKIYYDHFDKTIKCGIIGIEMSEEEKKSLSQFGELQYSGYWIKNPILAYMRYFLVFEKSKYINFIVHYANSPELIFSLYDQKDVKDQCANISQLFNAQENDIINTTLKNAKRLIVE